MWRSKKVISGVVLAAVLLAGSLGGAVLAQENENDNADNNRPGTEFLERLAGKLGITIEELQGKIAEVREELREECGDVWQDKQRPAGRFGNIGERLGIDIDEDAWKTAMAEARERIQAGEDRQQVMAEVLESFGVDIEELKAKFAGDADGKRPLIRGFRGHGGFRGFCKPAPAD